MEVSVSSSEVVVTWTLESPVPESLGTAPGWGKNSAGWSLGLPQFDQSGEGFQVGVLLELIEAQWFASTNRTEPFDDGLYYRDVDPATIRFDGTTISVPYPIENFGEFPSEFPFYGAAETFVSTGGIDDPLAGFWITDEVCGTFESPAQFPP